jgi:hypothetical protein
MNNATDFELTEIVIESTNGTEIDIVDLMVELNVYENIHNSCISADIAVYESLNIVKHTPITGHEWIRFSYRTPNQQVISLRLRIFKVSNKQMESMHSQVFVLHCTDNIDFLNARTRISKAYKGKLISDIAQDVQTNFLASSFNFLEPTQNLHHIIPGYWTPFKTMNFLASRANSTQYAGSNFVYYQTVDGFNFLSIEKLCDIKPLNTYMLQPANIRDTTVSEGYIPRTVDSDQKAIQSFKFESTFDTLENATHGMYTNDLLWHDIQKKQFGENVFNYPNSYDKYKHVELNNVTGGLSELWTTPSDFDNDSYGEMRFMPIGLPNQENYTTQWIQQRISQMQQLQNVRLTAVIPGDSTRRAGDLIQIVLPSPESNVQDQIQLEDYFTNRYLVVGLRHQINRTQYTTTMELIKDSVYKAFP